MSIKSNKLSFLDLFREKILVYLCIGILRALWATVQWKLKNADIISSIRDGGDTYIFVFWHNQQIFMPTFFKRYLSFPGKRIFALVSRHRDGLISGRIIKYFGIEAVYGSSTRGSLGAFRQLYKKLKQGSHIAITPDGPKGPIYKFKRGSISLAHLSGVCLLPLSAAPSRRWQFKSWDAFILPQPFSRIVVAAGIPIRIPANASEKELDGYVEKLEAELNQLTNLVEESVNK